MSDRGILFDLDGTLWDSAEQVAVSWNEVVMNYHLEPKFTTQNIQSVMGKTLDQIGKIFFPDMEQQKLNEMMKACSEYEVEYIKKVGGMLYPKLEATLDSLSKNYKLAVVSNCQNGYIEAFLDYHNLRHYFCDNECAGNTGLSKGENIKLVIERNHLQQTAYVGDTKWDYEASVAAGVPFIHAAYGFGKVPEALYKIESIDALEKRIEEVWR